MKERKREQRGQRKTKVKEKRKGGERRRHPLRNKPWKKELHHQDEPWIRSLERMIQWRKRMRERKREGGIDAGSLL